MDRKSNIEVVVRLRPFEGPSCISDVNDNVIKIKNSKMPFVFDKVFEPGCTQSDVFNTSGRSIVDGVLCGYNGCVMAYGQTGSGKSHTMMGPPGTSSSYTSSSYTAASGTTTNGTTSTTTNNATGTINEESGLIPRMLDHLFAQKQPNHKIKVGFMEIYNEKVFDLLESTDLKQLRIHEQQDGSGFYVKGLKQVEVHNAKEVFKVMEIGDNNRRTASTLMNSRSSRSHSVFFVDVESAQFKAKLVLVDLAGSEKVGKTGARGLLLEEATNINKSLSTLGMVVNALSSEQTHVPFRDSKLTRILQDSLSGSSRTCLIVQCSPMEIHHQETLSSLRFGVRAKQVKMEVKPNLVLPLDFKNLCFQTQLDLNTQLKKQNGYLKLRYQNDKKRMERQRQQIEVLKLCLNTFSQ